MAPGIDKTTWPRRGVLVRYVGLYPGPGYAEMFGEWPGKPTVRCPQGWHNPARTFVICLSGVVSASSRPGDEHVDGWRCPCC